MKNPNRVPSRGESNPTRSTLGKPRKKLMTLAGSILGLSLLISSCSAEHFGHSDVRIEVGDNSYRQPHIRKNVSDLTAEEKTEFVAAIKKLKSTPAPDDDGVANWYDHFVAEHWRKLTCWSTSANMGGYGHYGPDLITWHRAFLLEFEDALSTVSEKQMSIPFWDWTDKGSLDAMLATDFMGPGGTKKNNYVVDQGPFRKGEWEIKVKGPTDTNPGQKDYLVRAIGTVSMAPTPPTADEVKTALSRDSYDAAPWNITTSREKSFRSTMDGVLGASGQSCGTGNTIGVDGMTGLQLHSRGHAFIGGQDNDGNPGALMDTITSPNDPIFWLHHANVDRISEQWWSAHDYQFTPDNDGPIGDNADDPMAPYEFTNRQMAAPTSHFGYSYGPAANDPKAVPPSPGATQHMHRM